MQGAPDCARLFGAGVRGAQLTEDLRLADDHRVQPGGYREQMLHTGGRVVHVEVLGQFVERYRGLARQHIGDIGEATVEGRDHRIDFDPVTGRQQQRLRDVLARKQLTQHLTGVRGRHRDSFQHFNRRTAMRQTDNQKTHRLTAIGSIGSTTGPTPLPLHRRTW